MPPRKAGGGRWRQRPGRWHLCQRCHDPQNRYFTSNTANGGLGGNGGSASGGYSGNGGNGGNGQGGGIYAAKTGADTLTTVSLSKNVAQGGGGGSGSDAVTAAKAATAKAAASTSLREVVHADKVWQ